MSTYLNISDKIGLQSTPNPLLLNLYGGAAAAYSLRQLDYNYTGSAITVRRSSDNTTKDIGFINGELDTASLEAFTNEDYVRLTSNYSGANPYPNAATNSLTVTSNQSALGVDEALKCTITGVSPYFYSSSFGGAGIEFNISFDYYIPSGQSLQSIRVGVGSPEQTFDTTGQWANANFNQTSTYSFIIFRGNSNTVGDEFYIKNLVMTQTSADGYVTTWYDQSGNGINATQTSDAYQPKIVSLGSTILDNSKPTIQFDGVDDGFTTLIPGSSVFDFYAVTHANIYDDYILPDNDSVSGTYYGYISRGDAGSTTIHSNYGSPSLYVNGNLENPVTRLDVRSLIATGSELIQVHQGADTSLWNNIELFKRSGFEFAGTSKEVIIYDTDQSANRANIESNINSYYSIY